jgi:hypothetical protein
VISTVYLVDLFSFRKEAFLTAPLAVDAGAEELNPPQPTPLKESIYTSSQRATNTLLAATIHKTQLTVTRSSMFTERPSFEAPAAICQQRV